LMMLGGVAALTTSAVHAADFYPDQAPAYDAPYAPPPTYNAPYAPPPAYEPPRSYNGYYPPPPHAAATEQCRTYTKARIDEWGRQVLRRVRVCEAVVGPTPAYPPSPYVAPSPYAPAPTGAYWNGADYGAPRPPLEVGVPYGVYR